MLILRLTDPILLLITVKPLPLRCHRLAAASALSSRFYSAAKDKETLEAPVTVSGI